MNDNDNDNNMYQLDKELGHVAPLFFSRIITSFQMNHENENLVSGHIMCILIYLQSQNCKQYAQRFVNLGGVQLTLYILKHAFIYPSHVLIKTLSIIKMIIKINGKFKEIICINGGIQLLLNIVTDKLGQVQVNENFLYLLYDILKQLCIRNESHKLFIQETIIKYIKNNLENHKAIKTMLRVLQSTLTFNDDKMITKENMNNIFSLLQFGNHQIIYQLQSLSSIILKSHRGQIILIQSLLKLLNETSQDKNQKEYADFIEKMAKQNMDILTCNAKKLLTQM